jgi:multiple antibiotic resistance protein
MAVPPVAPITLGETFTFLFLLLGPVKILGPFISLTKDDEPPSRRRLAVRATLFSAAALAAAALAGETLLANFRIRLQVLAISAGLVLLLTALDTVLRQFRTPAGAEINQPKASPDRAVRPLAFPIIVTPSGIAAVIIFVSLSQGPEGVLMIGALIALVLVLDLVAMLFARPVVKWLGMPLLVLGVVLGVIQVALGLNIILVNLSAIGVFTMTR